MASDLGSEFVKGLLKSINIRVPRPLTLKYIRCGMQSQRGYDARFCLTHLARPVWARAHLNSGSIWVGAWAFWWPFGGLFTRPIYPAWESLFWNARMQICSLEVESYHQSLELVPGLRLVMENVRCVLIEFINNKPVIKHSFELIYLSLI